MLCTCPSKKSKHKFQQIPTININYRLNALLNKLNAADPLAPIYCYIMDSVKEDDNHLRHTGSGPNWQGGIITLCTCKHLMRTYPDVKQGTWIAGFSNSKAGRGENFLIYLMRIAQTFESHYDLWYHLTEESREAKAADINPLGDIFRPLGRETQEHPYEPSQYYEPCKDHSHGRNQYWHRDIKYTTKKGKHPLLLVGDENYSFVWDQYLITFKENIGRGQRRLTLKEFKIHLQDSEGERFF
jgi:hypothetical protein